MKKIILWVLALIIACANMSCSKPDYKKVANDFIATATPIRDYTIREVDATSSPKWKAVVVYIKRGRTNMPIILFVSDDGLYIVPNSMVYVNNKPIFTKKIEPELGKIDFQLSGKDRFVYNPSGNKTVYMFTDPDCPFCNQAREKLRNYKGEYRVVVKYFPLEQIHPGSTNKAIAEQAEWLKDNRKDLVKKADIVKEAQRMVEEDIMEAGKAEITSVPAYILEDGTLKQGLF